MRADSEIRDLDSSPFELRNCAICKGQGFVGAVRWLDSIIDRPTRSVIQSDRPVWSRAVQSNTFVAPNIQVVLVDTRDVVRAEVAFSTRFNLQVHFE